MSDAADKLARTRLAIIAHLQARERRHERDNIDFDDEPRSQAHGTDAPRAGFREHMRHSTAAGWFARARRIGRTWWRHHPASMGLDMAKPALSAYAAQKPVQYLGLAAAAGVVIALTRPWRLVSGTGLLLAVLKSSQLSSLVMSAMAGADYGGAGEPPA
jgi:hypothetical protein